MHGFLIQVLILIASRPKPMTCISSAFVCDYIDLSITVCYVSLRGGVFTVQVFGAKRPHAVPHVPYDARGAQSTDCGRTGEFMGGRKGD